MSGQEVYFFIDLNILPQTESVFPFSIYIYQPQSNLFSIDLHPNSPFNEETITKYKAIIEKGGKLAINYRQKKTFLLNLNLKEEDVPSLKPKLKNELELKREQKLEQLEHSAPFLIGTELNIAFESNDWNRVVDRAKLEIMTLPLNISYTVSNAVKFCDYLLEFDNFQNRVVSLTYFLAKAMKITEEEDLGDLICASFLYDIGMSQLDSRYYTIHTKDYNDDAQKDFEKHPALSIHLIRKSGLKISNRTKSIIEEHHERYDGKGFPMQKQSPYLEPMSQILGLADHVLSYSEGKISGEKMPLKQIISAINSQTPIKGLELSFHKDLRDLLYAMAFTVVDEAAVQTKKVA